MVSTGVVRRVGVAAWLLVHVSAFSVPAVLQDCKLGFVTLSRPQFVLSTESCPISPSLLDKLSCTRSAPHPVLQGLRGLRLASEDQAQHRILPLNGIPADLERDRKRFLAKLGGATLLLQTAVPDVQAKQLWGKPNVFVAGGTGRTGRELVQELSDSGYSVRAGVRSMVRARKLGLDKLKGVKLVDCDVEKPSDLVDVVKGSEIVVCTIGFVPTYIAGEDKRLAQKIDAQGTIALIEAAKAAKVQKFFLVSSLLTGSPPGTACIPGFKFLEDIQTLNQLQV